MGLELTKDNKTCIGKCAIYLRIFGVYTTSHEMERIYEDTNYI